MFARRFAMFAAGAVLIALIAGCAAQRTDGVSSTALDPAAAVRERDLSGTWRGESWPVGTDSTSRMHSAITLEVKDDATYRLSTTRTGTSPSNESGVVVLNGSTVVLRSKEGQETQLTRKGGGALYGVMTGRYPMTLMLERAQ
jgi:hypothetical protein